MHDKSDYWLDICEEDISAANALLQSNRLLWAGFITHLIVEKALKALIANKTGKVPPKIHHLPRLAKIAGVFDELSDDQKSLLRKLMPLHIEARYPEYKRMVNSTLTYESSKQLLKEAEEFLCWTKKKLGK